MRTSVEKTSGGWLVLFCACFAGTSAADVSITPICILTLPPSGISGAIEWRYDRNIERHQAMLSNQARDQIASEAETGLQQKAGRAQTRIRAGSFEPLAVSLERARFQTNQDDSTKRGFRTDDAQQRALILELIADADLDLSKLIAQDQSPTPSPATLSGRTVIFCSRTAGLNSNPKNSRPFSTRIAGEKPLDHVRRCVASPFKTITLRPSFKLSVISTVIHSTPNRRMVARRTRQLYNFQNHSCITCMTSFSHLRDARYVLGIAEFGSKSSPRPSVLRLPRFPLLGEQLEPRGHRKEARAVIPNNPAPDAFGQGKEFFTFGQIQQITGDSEATPKGILPSLDPAGAEVTFAQAGHQFVKRSSGYPSIVHRQTLNLVNHEAILSPAALSESSNLRRQYQPTPNKAV